MLVHVRYEHSLLGSVLVHITFFPPMFNRPRLKEHMQYCLNHPEEISKLSQLKAQITEVKGIMMDNIEKVCFSFLGEWCCL